MAGPPAERRRFAWRSLPAAWPVLVVASLPLLAYWLQGDIGLDFTDEGFLWYGVQRVLQGEVPVRDFQAYDIGRYYGAAAWMRLVDGHGLLALRAGHAVVASVTVALASWLVWRSHAPSAVRRWVVLLAGLTFALWLVPDYKIADGFAAVMLTAALAAVVHRPTPARHGLYGLALGVAGTLGINHATYGVVGFVLLVAWRRFCLGERTGARDLGWLALGGAVGYAPVLAFHLGVPGFFDAFVDAQLQLVEARTTNLPLPLPQLGAVLETPSSREGLRESLLALAFVATPLFWLACANKLRPPRLGTERPSATFIAAALLSLPYAHYAWSRADGVHVALSIIPLAIAAWSGPWRTAPSLLTLAALAGVTATALAAPSRVGYAPLLGWRPLVPVVVQGDRLRVSPYSASQLALLNGLLARHASEGGSFYAAPYQPGAYAVAGRRSPTHEIYALFPASRWRQHGEIARLAAADVAFALLTHDRFDGRPDLGFDRTHPAILDYLYRCMQRQSGPAALPQVEVLVRRDGGCLPQAAAAAAAADPGAIR